MSILKVKKLNNDAIIPNFTAANHYNMYSSEDVLLKAGAVVAVKTGISLSFTNTHCARPDIKLLGGLIDSDYRGEVKMIVIPNNSNNDIFIKRGELVGKIFLAEIATPEIRIKEELEKQEIVDVFN